MNFIIKSKLTRSEILIKQEETLRKTNERNLMALIEKQQKQIEFIGEQNKLLSQTNEDMGKFIEHIFNMIKERMSKIESKVELLED